MITLDKELIEKGQSPRGGIRSRQLKVFGEVRSKGWYKRLLGKRVTERQYNKYIALRDNRTRKDIANNKKNRRSFKSKKKRANDKYKKEYYDYLKSKEWADIRIDLFNARGKKCEYCDNVEKLQIHHLHYRNIFKEEPEDLVILCDSCHKNEHGIK